MTSTYVELLVLAWLAAPPESDEEAAAQEARDLAMARLGIDDEQACRIIESVMDRYESVLTLVEQRESV